MKFIDIISENLSGNLSENLKNKITRAKLIYKALKKGASTHQVYDNDLKLLTYEFKYELSDDAKFNFNLSNKVIVTPKYFKIDGPRIRGQQTHVFEELKAKFWSFGIVLDTSDHNKIIYTQEGESEPIKIEENESSSDKSSNEIKWDGKLNRDQKILRAFRKGKILITNTDIAFTIKYEFTKTPTLNPYKGTYLKRTVYEFKISDKNEWPLEMEVISPDPSAEPFKLDPKNFPEFYTYFTKLLYELNLRLDRYGIELEVNF